MRVVQSPSGPARLRPYGPAFFAAWLRDFMDAVLDLMPSSRTDVEFLPDPA